MTPKPHTVLIVDDTLENLRVLGEMLEMDGHEVRIASQGAQALEMAKIAPPDLILLDVMMPGMDGHEVCRRLKADPAMAEIPVIFLTALNDEADEALGLDLGAVDYVTKPFKMNLVRKRIYNHLSLHQLQQESQAHNAHLEEVVAERTRELSTANQRLRVLDSTKTLFLKLLSQVVQAPANGLVGIGQLALKSIDDPAKRTRLEALFESNKGRLEDILGQYQKLVDLLQTSAGGRLHPVRLEETLTKVWSNAVAALPALTLPAGRSFIVATEEGLLSDALTPVVRFVTADLAPGTEVTAQLEEHDGSVTLRLRVPGPSALREFRSLEEVPAQGEGLALSAAVLGALGGRAELGPAAEGFMEFRLVLPSYRA